MLLMLNKRDEVIWVYGELEESFPCAYHEMNEQVPRIKEVTNKIAGLCCLYIFFFT